MTTQADPTPEPESARAPDTATGPGSSRIPGPAPDTGPEAPRRAVERGRRRPAWPVWTGAILLVVGLAALGWAAWTVLTPPVDPAAAAREVAALRASWAGAIPTDAATPGPNATAGVTAEPTATAGGTPGPSGILAPTPTPTLTPEAVAILRVPTLGAEVPVFAGTSDEALARGAGWYVGTAAPGAVGNLGLAAHGAPRGPLAGLGTLQPGAEVVVETREATFTYALDNAPASSQVANTDFWILDPVPGHPGDRPTEALITVTTSFDAWSTPRRMVAWGRLIGAEPRTDAGAQPR